MNVRSNIMEIIAFGILFGIGVSAGLDMYDAAIAFLNIKLG